MKTTLEEIAKLNGFKNEKEFHKLVASTIMVSPNDVSKFRHWQINDGTKKGLLLLKQKGE